MALDRRKFFDGIRSGPFPGSLSPEAVTGIEAILHEWERRRLTDLRWLAYMLATVLAECGRNMLPVREGFAKSDAAARAYVKRRGYKYAAVVGGQVYYGRGLVQLTWVDNYRKMGQILGLDLVADPDKTLLPHFAAAIMFEGMIRGSFTGKKLADYFTPAGSDWVNARRIINGTDRAAEIAGYAKQFHADLLAADVTAPVPQPAPSPVAPKPDKAKEAAKVGAGAGGAGAVIVGTQTAAEAGWTWLEIGIVLAVLVFVGITAWRIWKVWKEHVAAMARLRAEARAADIEAQGLAAVETALAQPATETKEPAPWTGDQLLVSSPQSRPDSEPSSEQLSAARLALQSVASPATPSPAPSAQTQPRKRSAAPSPKTRQPRTSSRGSKPSAAKKSSPRRKPRSRASNRRG